MKRIISLMLIGIFALSIVCPIMSASDDGIKTGRQTIVISTSEKGLLVEEKLLVNNTGNENVTSIKFWIQQDAEEIKVLAVDSAEDLTVIATGNVRECNLTSHDLTLKTGDSLNLRLTYTLPTDTENFEKTLLYDTTFLSVTFNERELYHGENLLYNSESSNSLWLILYRPTEAPLSMLYVGAILLLLIILIASTLLLLRKQRSKAKKSIVESEEMLITKKALLLSLLKDIEKQHRVKDISDDTYNKLKGEYKQQAVDAMKKLEDMKK